MIELFILLLATIIQSFVVVNLAEFDTSFTLFSSISIGLFVIMFVIYAYLISTNAISKYRRWVFAGMIIVLIASFVSWVGIVEYGVDNFLWAGFALLIVMTVLIAYNYRSKDKGDSKKKKKNDLSEFDVFALPKGNKSESSFSSIFE